MTHLLRLSRAVDRLSELVGRSVSWLALVMVLVGAGNALARFAGRYLGKDLSSTAALELQWYLFSLLFLLGAAWALRQDKHVRVDVLHGRLSRRTRAWVDVAGSLLFLLPFCVVALLLSWPTVRNSIAVSEVSADPGGLPRWPIKLMVMPAFALLGLQGLSELIKRVALLRGLDGGEAEPTDRQPELLG